MSDGDYPDTDGKTFAFIVAILAACGVVREIYQLSGGLPDPASKIASIVGFIFTYWIVWIFRDFIFGLIGLAIVLAVLGLVGMWIFS